MSSVAPKLSFESCEDLANRLSMSEIIRLQDILSKALTRRFEKRLALAFSDIVGSTSYFAAFGDEAGRKLQQRHFDFVRLAMSGSEGRIVDTAGDGVFLCFPQGDEALRAMIEVQRAIATDNDSRSPGERLAVRIGCHSGPVLTDGVDVSGDSVNLCARIASSAEAGEVRLSRDALQDLNDAGLRTKCLRLPAVALKGIDRPVELFSLDWRDDSLPARVRFDEGSIVTLPNQDVVRFGRLKEHEGMSANDIVLQSGDPAENNRISRWHFELRRRSSGFVLRSMSDALTEVDGRQVSKGEDATVRLGSRICVGGVLTMELIGPEERSEGDRTMIVRTRSR